MCGWDAGGCLLLSLSLSFSGKYGTEIRPAFWLNFVFLLFPVWGAVTLFTKPKDRPLIGGYNVSQGYVTELIWKCVKRKMLFTGEKNQCDAAHK